MAPPFVDYTGQVFNFWTVKSFTGRDKHNHPIWLCRCECGTEKCVLIGSLRKGVSKSCGCKTISLRSEKLRKHGMAGTPTYKSWHQMHQRCAGKHGHNYYVENGITVCERWGAFENFLADMGERPVGTTLDRIDGTKGYSPDNCRWADVFTQANNKKTNIKQMVCGELMTPAQASRRFNKHISGIRHRLRKGFTLEQAIFGSLVNLQKEAA